MENAEYKAVYKCRLCGEEFFDNKIKARKIEDFLITNILAQMQQTVLIEKPNRADLHRLHNCKDGSYGFSDFQGFKKVEDNAKFYDKQPKITESYAVGKTE